MLSQDGRTWQSPLMTGGLPLRSVAYGAGSWVAVGYNMLLHSTDGLSWQSPMAGLLPPRQVDVTYGGPAGRGLFAAVGSGNGVGQEVVLTSPDGMAWTPRPTPALTAVGQLTGIAHGTPLGQDVWVAVGARGQVVRSTDGVTWMPAQPLAGVDLRAVAWGADRFIAVGAKGVVATSLDGTTWVTLVAGTLDLEDIVRGNGLWLAAGRGALLASTDGVQWTPRTVAGMPAGAWWKGVAYGGGRYVALAIDSPVADSNAGALATSTDGTAWQVHLVAAHRGDAALAAAYGNGRWVAVGTTSLSHSDDGVTWWIGHSSQWGYGYAAATDGKAWVTPTIFGAIAQSPDGLRWRVASSGLSAYPSGLYGAAFGAGTWVVTGQNGMVLSSEDRMQWARHATPTQEALYGVAHRAGQWVAVGSGGTILASPDGKTWTAQDSGTTAMLLGVAWGDGRWVAVGLWGTMLASSDGVRWEPIASGTSAHLHAVAHAASASGTRWIAGSRDATLRSSDGVTWAPTAVGDGSWRGFAWGNGAWVAAGGYTFATSPDGEAWSRGAWSGWQHTVASTHPATLECAPSAGQAAAGETVRLHGGGGRWPYAWSAPGGSPALGSGASHAVTFATPGTYTVQVSDALGATASCTVEVAPPPPASHTHAISFRSPGASLHAEVLAYDELEAPLANATVTGEFCGPANCITRSGTTDADGRVQLNWRGATDPGTYTLCVTAIAAAGKPFDAAAGHAEQGNCATATV
jgi:hypothetical protein